MNTQYKKGVLPMCVLSILKKQDCYGYQLSALISKEINVSEGTIYPLLKRMRTEELVSTYLKESDEGPPRKYYRMTEEGQKKYLELKEEWEEFTGKINNLISEDEDE